MSWWIRVATALTKYFKMVKLLAVVVAVGLLSLIGVVQPVGEPDPDDDCVL